MESTTSGSASRLALTLATNDFVSRGTSVLVSNRRIDEKLFQRQLDRLQAGELHRALHVRVKDSPMQSLQSTFPATHGPGKRHSPTPHRHSIVYSARIPMKHLLSQERPAIHQVRIIR